MVSAHSSMDEFNKSYDELMSYYMKHEFIIDEPISYQMNIPSMNTTKELNFLPITLKVLGFDPSLPLSEQK